MKPQATIWAIGTYHNIFRIGAILQALGFWILNDVIWVKTNPMPNWLNARLTNATETLIWAVKDRKAKGYIYHAEIAQEYSDRKLASNVWHLPICTGRERLKDQAGKKLHSTQKPEALLERIIRIASNPGDVVLDPMAGTGTTDCGAKKWGRRFVMMEKHEAYVQEVHKRLAQVQGALHGSVAS